MKCIQPMLLINIEHRRHGDIVVRCLRNANPWYQIYRRSLAFFYPFIKLACLTDSALHRLDCTASNQTWSTYRRYVEISTGHQLYSGSARSRSLPPTDFPSVSARRWLIRPTRMSMRLISEYTLSAFCCRGQIVLCYIISIKVQWFIFLRFSSSSSSSSSSSQRDNYT